MPSKTAGAAETAARILERVWETLPAIAERASLTEQLRKLPEETIQELTDAGVFAALTPRAFGGDDLGPRFLADVGEALARACLSTAWTVQFLMQGSAMTARFPIECQNEAFADTPYALTAGGLSSMGTATPTEGGHLVSGRWGFVTGIMHAKWVRLGAVVSSPNEPAEARAFMVPKADVSIHDDWDTLGLRGTGSHDVSAENVFVPIHRSLPARTLESRTNPGAALHGGFARVPLSHVSALILPSQAVGAAKAAVQIFASRMRTRRTAFAAYKTQADAPAAQARYARATANVRIAALLLESMIVRIETLADDAAAPLSRAEEALLKLDAGTTCHVAARTISSVCRASGATATRSSEPLSRFERDIHTLLAHPANDMDWLDESCGKALLAVTHEGD